jgi:hypothetical protein
MSVIGTGSRQYAHTRKVRTYPKGRICFCCGAILSMYNNESICMTCNTRINRAERAVFYDADGLPMRLTSVDARILMIGTEFPCVYLPFTKILGDLAESTVKSSIGKLSRCGWVFHPKYGHGWALVAEPAKGRRSE